MKFSSENNHNAKTLVITQSLALFKIKQMTISVSGGLFNSNRYEHKRTHSVPWEEDIFMEMTGFKTCRNAKNHN